MADSALILYLGFLEGLIYHFQKLGQRDLNKIFVEKFVKTYLKLLLINHQAGFNEIYVRCPSKKGYVSLFKSF